MKEEFFSYLETILKASTASKKIESFLEFYKKYKEDSLTFNHSYNAEIFTKPSFDGFCKIVDAIKVPRRRSLQSNEDKAILIHAIAHIEYSAIDLALDHAYRFQNMPKEFYNDWLEVAYEEVNHFLMLEKLLNSLGYKYSDFEVHSFLFDTSMRTLDLVSRMAVIPRYLEASGLDANPKIIDRVKRLNNGFSKELIDILNIILHEEVSHVKKGDKWFKYACEKYGIDEMEFFNIVEKYLPGASKKKEFLNIDLRQKAGYSCSELKVLSKDSIEC